MTLIPLVTASLTKGITVPVERFSFIHTDLAHIPALTFPVP